METELDLLSTHPSHKIASTLLSQTGLGGSESKGTQVLPKHLPDYL